MKIFRDEGKFGILFDYETLSFTMLPSSPRPTADRYIPPRVVSSSVGLPASPVRAYLEVTRRCNLTCTHCFVGSSPRAAIGMDTEFWKTLIVRLKELNVLDLRFTGGEITTRKDWYELLYFAKSLDFCVSANTNGVYDDENAVVGKLADLELNQVTVSLDGLQEQHDLLRGAGNFEIAFSSLCAMYKRGIKTRVNMVLTKGNFGDAPGLLRKISPFVYEVNFFFMRPVGRGRTHKELIGIEEYFESASLLEDSRSLHPNLKILHREQAISDRSFQTTLKSGHADFRKHLPSCTTTVNISWDGRYWPHGYNTYQNSNLCLGKYPIDDLDDVWNYSEKTKAFRDWQSALIERCGRCFLFEKECPGSNIEMEIAMQIGALKSNPYCISSEPAPRLSFMRSSAMQSS